MQAQTYVRRHKSVYAARVLETEVWNESLIIWEPFQTPIFQLYKALNGTFSKDRENLKGKPKNH